jgi:hypothetical protein
VALQVRPNEAGGLGYVNLNIEEPIDCRCHHIEPKLLLGGGTPTLQWRLFSSFPIQRLRRASPHMLSRVSLAQLRLVTHTHWYREVRYSQQTRR